MALTLFGRRCAQQAVAEDLPRLRHPIVFLRATFDNSRFDAMLSDWIDLQVA